jgi:hypothetical protein
MHRVDLTDLARISEAHYSDVFGAAMRRFHDKYKDAGPEFFVNFNPVVSDPRDKTILGQQSDIPAPKSGPDAGHPLFKKPDHSDPVGTYVYPAEYVANHWHDLQYGSDMGNLRVLKVNTDPEHTLILSDMTQDQFLEAMKRLNLEFHVRDHGWIYTRSKRDAIAIYEAIFEWEAPSAPHHRVNSYGKVLFKLIQNDYRFEPNVPEEDEDADEEEGENWNAFMETGLSKDSKYSSAGEFKYEGQLKVQHVTELTQIKQTRRLLKAKYEVVIDRAKTPLEATIYPSEPEQAVCLTKRSYEVVDTYKIQNAAQGDQTVRPERLDREKLTKKAGWLIAKTMGESITENVSHFFNREGVNQPGRIRNLHILRNWISTERVEQHPISSWDPTGQMTAIDAWVTTKGNLIVVDTVVARAETVADPQAKARTHQSVSKARIRPGEDQQAITDNLTSYVDSAMDKSEHRKFGAHNTISFAIGLVTAAAQPTFIRTRAKESLSDLPAKVQEALHKNSATAPFKRITNALLEEFVKAAKKKVALVKPHADSAASTSAGNPPTATPAAPGDTSAHPTP